jgi:hypothetical protein
MKLDNINPQLVRVGDTVTVVARVIKVDEAYITVDVNGRRIEISAKRPENGVTFSRESPEWPGPNRIGWARLKGNPESALAGTTGNSHAGSIHGTPIFRSVTGVSHSWDHSVTEWTEAVHPDSGRARG